MNFETCITVLRTELNLKHPVVKSEEVVKPNEDERRLELIYKIQLIALKIMKDIANGQFPVINSISVSWKNCLFDGRLQLNESREKAKVLDFKRKNCRADFAKIVFLLSKIHKLLMTQQTSTRRELYYKNLDLFKSQNEVDKEMKEICYLLNAPEWELNVFASPKGIVAGPVVFILTNGETIDCRKPGGVSISQEVLQIEKMSSSATWVLIVEKDTCFQRLIASENIAKLSSCILLTGKGYPDVNSRILVCKIWQLLQIPILTLVDADPHGFEIMCVYRFGSLSKSPYSKYLSCPAVRWLGIHPSDIRPLILDSSLLSEYDKKKIRWLLKRRYVEEDENLKAQLEILLQGNVKAEIEGIVGFTSNYLTEVYIKHKIKCEEYL